VTLLSINGAGDVYSKGSIHAKKDVFIYEDDTLPLKAAYGGGATGTAGAAAGYVTLKINGATYKLLYQA
jgi:hypothetical protein